jgi:hypothetical protein
MKYSWTCLLVSVALLSIWACSLRTGGIEGPGEETPDPDLHGPDLFEEVSASSGIDFSYRNGEEITPPHLAILESLGGGVALIDYDGDGLLDIFLPGGGYFDGPDKKQIRGLACKLYKNLGNWKFKDVTREVGLDSLAGGRPWFYTHAAAVGDYNRDGWPDLLVTGWGRVALFQNIPDGKGGRRFEDVSARAGLDLGITWATSAAWADLDGDGWPDLYVCQYVNWSFANHPACQYDGKTPDVCPPKKFDGLQHKVYRNNANGTFTDVTKEAGIKEGGKDVSKGLGVLVVDVNLDGKPEVYVANDTVPKFFYANQSTPGAIRLKEMGMNTGCAVDSQGRPNGSMGLDAGDFECTGRPALWVTNYEREYHALYRNFCQKDHFHFYFCSPSAGITALDQNYVSWGTGFLDLDHHGWEDLFIANGHAIRFPTGAPRAQKPLLMRNWEGRYKNISARGGSFFQRDHLSRGAALGDLNNDGKIDLVVSNLNEPVAILRNIAPDGNHWIGVELAGAAHADVVGSRVVVEAGGRKQTRFTKGGGSYASSGDRRFVIGLGQTDHIDKLSVIWADGSQQDWTGLAIDRYHLLAQGQKEARVPGAKK